MAKIRKSDLSHSKIYNTLCEADATACYLCRCDIPHSLKEHAKAVKDGLNHGPCKNSRFDWTKPEDRALYREIERAKARVRNMALRDRQRKAS